MTEITPELQKRKEKSKNTLAQVYNLPSIPLVMMEVTRLLNNPNTSAIELAKVISRDQALVTKILSVANSPLYGLPRRVSTIDFAIIILGFDHIKNIVIALSMMEAFKNKSDKNLNQKKYWTHSILTASAAKRIADDLGFHFTGEAFTAGLLHDLGIPVIHKYFNSEFIKIQELAEQENLSYKQAQQEVIGLEHQQIGNLLAQRWNLPLSLSDSILYHHTPSMAEQNVPLAAIVHLADYMTVKLDTGCFQWDGNFELDKKIITILNLRDEEFLENFIMRYKEPFLSQVDAIQI
ncbi:MAG: HDOD domain-containing protein [Ignavibacteria bacterium]|jgi:putative nucleotidyltransferase with HDIG domain|nr:HDOD domain-containing protein [Ignavibacteria bacterium]MCU7501916.1 HDOD domain-containing protein [Ignavibacteria bacterium]MCU7514738.1 HDOD domain-containing protein [Ignavibacteria bacterium]